MQQGLGERLTAMSLVSAGFAPPEPVHTDQFRLALLGPKYNESDYAAWTSSMDFIRRLPGWETSSWPRPMTIEENLRDCTSHLARSSSGIDFAYTVLLPDRDQVIGCVYFKPTRPPRRDAVDVGSWVTAEHSDLDKPLYEVVTQWLADDWPWSAVEYDAR
jgi:RimJ/RimL family protein N-acetyltransferase